MEDAGAPAGRHGDPLVSCDGCGFEWHGAISADGLRVIGHCPRCQGRLRFADGRSSEAQAEDAVTEQQPWQVLGTPSSWAR